MTLPKDKDIEDDGDEYRLAGWDDKRPAEPTPVAPPIPSTSDAEEPEERPRRRPRPTLPRRPFLDGTFTFPFSSKARLYAAILAGWSAVAAHLVATAVGLGETPSPGSWLGCALVGALALMVSVAWFVFASAVALAVTRGTAAGGDAIGDWPGFDVFQYLGEPLYLFNSLCLSVLPGVLIGSALAILGLPPTIPVWASNFIFFPILLLSLLETGSPWGAVSAPVWRTFRCAARGWLEFYLAAAMLFTISIVAGALAARLGGVAAIVLIAVLETAVWLIYFRLLGRLAWYCADRMAAAMPEDGDGDDDAEMVELDLIDERSDDVKPIPPESY